NVFRANRPGRTPLREALMRHRAPWALSLALLAGLGAAAAAQEPAPPSPPPQTGGSWLPNLWPFSQPQKKAAPAPKTPAVESAATLRARELAAWQRRAAVCLRLREIARQTNDDDLERRAEQLQDEAFALYTQRVALLPAEGGSQSDAQVLRERLN